MNTAQNWNKKQSILKKQSLTVEDKLYISQNYEISIVQSQTLSHLDEFVQKLTLAT